MIRKIKLSKRTSNKLEKLLDYLENEWSLNVTLFDNRQDPKRLKKEV